MSTEFENMLSDLNVHFEALEIEFFIIGAKARDIISEISNLKLSPRKTTDVDFGILVDSWETLESLRNRFEKDPNIKLSSSKDNKVRYYHQGTPFDLVPFGGVEKSGKTSFPPFYDTMITVVGYQEALNSAQLIKVGNVSIKVTTPEMLVALKIVAWDENSSRQKDAQDIGFIMSKYESIDPDVYEYTLDNYIEILEHFDHESLFASLAVMGIRIKNFINKDHYNLIIDILANASKKEKLSRDMVSISGVGVSEEEIALSMIDALLFGLNH